MITEISPLLFLLLPLAAFTGWVAARRDPVSKKHSKSSQLTREYFMGLNYLLNEEPDKAVDVFIKMIEVDSETVETHLALGNLFRRRGEVERAIRIHQNLIARPHLSHEHRTHALLELGQDYLRAGRFDRAERLFLEVLELGEKTKPSLQYLLDIYQQEKEWEQALKIAQQLDKSGSPEMQPVMAHYYCELAERAREKNNVEQAYRYLKKALAIDRNCVRASLIEAELEQNAKRYKPAIRAYKRIRHQDADFLNEAIPPLIECYEKLGDAQSGIAYLRQCLDDHPRVSIILFFVDRLLSTEGVTASTEFLSEQLQRRPSIRGLQRLIELHLQNTHHGSEQENLLILRDLTTQLLHAKPNYRCQHCGYTAKNLSWQCPSCKHWNSVKPIQGIEGE